MRLPLLSGIVDTIVSKSIDAFIAIVIVFLICIIGFIAVGLKWISTWTLVIFIPLFIVASIAVFYGFSPWRASMKAKQAMSMIDNSTGVLDNIIL